MSNGVKKVKIEGELELDTQNYVKFSEKDINFSGIKMAVDLLEVVTGVEFDYDNLPGFLTENIEVINKKRILSLRDFIIEILEKRFNVNIKICGLCGRYTPDNSEDKCNIQKGTCSYYYFPLAFSENYSPVEILKKGTTSRYFSDICILRSNSWIPKKISKEKKEG